MKVQGRTKRVGERGWSASHHILPFKKRSRQIKFPLSNHVSDLGDFPPLYIDVWVIYMLDRVRNTSLGCRDSIYRREPGSHVTPPPIRKTLIDDIFGPGFGYHNLDHPSLRNAGRSRVSTLHVNCRRTQ